ncbi:DUF2314 domain-containing protein [Sulfurovum sp.]|uniref:DUF2314 domain-containing protein n=1 Tax=Sulfurovum sp. TaxID=1969726 RepID=UPI003566BB89
MKLPSYEVDHYELDNGEELHREYPDSFSIPNKEIRGSLKPGNIVKLIFRMEETPGSDEVSVERMWVQVTKTHKFYYEGVLDNVPTGSECVNYGQTVNFKSCHVIDVYEDENT